MSEEKAAKTVVLLFSMFFFLLKSLYEEMILQGVIRKYPKVYLEDFYGGISYTASKLKNNPGRDPNPGAGDVRRAVAEYCILPMGKFL